MPRFEREGIVRRAKAAQGQWLTPRSPRVTRNHLVSKLDLPNQVLRCWETGIFRRCGENLKNILQRARETKVMIGYPIWIGKQKSAEFGYVLRDPADVARSLFRGITASLCGGRTEVDGDSSYRGVDGIGPKVALP
jgi:hypothetical protein